MLTIYSMIRTDDGLAVTCEAREEKGLTTLSNISVIINCECFKKYLPNKVLQHASNL